jgi:hypothetical protein
MFLIPLIILEYGGGLLVTFYLSKLKYSQSTCFLIIAVNSSDNFIQLNFAENKSVNTITE